MFRLWGKVIKNGKIIDDVTIDNTKSNLTLNQKMEQALEDMSLIFDIQKPMWLPDNTKDFVKFKKTQFKQDHFIESIEFDYFEIEMLEND